MDSDFWLNCWETKTIGFHESAPNELLRNNFKAFADKVNPKRIFVPLCGKSLDMAWLMAQGCHVVGVELSAIAVNELFETLDISRTVTETGKLQQFSGPDIDVFVGDLFDLTESTIGPIDAIYDRAALVAMAPEQRVKYVNHLITICRNAPQLIVTFYANEETLTSQSIELARVLESGPPFFVQPNQLATLYNNYYHISPVANHTSEREVHNTHPIECIWELLPTHT